MFKDNNYNKDIMWNPWHGCRKISEGCQNCYMYEQDKAYNVNSSQFKIVKTKFTMPIDKDRKGFYKIKSGVQIATCFTSDFFLEDADKLRDLAWSYIRERQDCLFFIITKRINRIEKCLPKDWNDGWDNVFINATVENQKRLDERLPLLLKLPLKKRGLVFAPLLENITFKHYIKDNNINGVSIGGESVSLKEKYKARVCKFEWIEHIYKQCIENNILCNIHQTGTMFEKDGKLYVINNKQTEKEQARKALLYLKQKYNNN